MVLEQFLTSDLSETGKLGAVVLNLCKFHEMEWSYIIMIENLVHCNE